MLASLNIRKTLPLFSSIIFLSSLPGLAPAAAIIWGTHADGGAMFCNPYTGWSTPLPGIRVPGGPIDFSKGALVQLWKAVGPIDDPRFYTGVVDPNYFDPSYKIDDILLDEAHIGYGWGPPGAPASGCWSRTADVNVISGDAIYAMAYSLPKTDIAEGAFASASIWTCEGTIAANMVERVDVPQTYYFDDLCVPVPEPEHIGLVLTLVAAWMLKRRCRNSPHVG